MSDIKFSKDYFIYPPKSQGVFPIQESDWNRVRGLIKSIIPGKKIYSTIASIMFGVSISSVFSLFNFYQLENLPDWTLPTNWTILIGSLVVGVALLIIDAQQKEIIKISSDFILSEMETIEKNFDKKLSES